ncbi:MAG: endolytic transglycosylase MltG [Prevotella sp.]|nr:endolytic transglycosylase MltG [Prevotella sp.]MDO5524778.1 endolytic transglycosylase MltG [Prevotella sp.]
MKNKKLLLLGCGLVALSAASLLYLMLLFPLSAKEQTRYVYINDGDNIDSVYAKLDTIASTMQKAGFRMLSSVSGYSSGIRSGRYAVKPSESAFTVWRRMKNGIQEPVSLTIPESRTMDRLAGALSRKLMLDSATVAQSLANQDFCAAYGYDTCTIAALFVPNTYDVYWNTSLEKFMKRMVKEHDRFWNKERTEKAESLGMTENEVATVASIIDEETANNAEKPMIAGMYCNRLKQGMPLQADPTVKFALKDFALRRIYHNMLTMDSPYNTYKNVGLPPGPIKIASIAGIDAVLNQVKHDYLYMCAKEDFSGTHNFAVTYQEHLRNAAKYSKALNERGIK